MEILLILLFLAMFILAAVVIIVTYNKSVAEERAAAAEAERAAAERTAAETEARRSAYARGLAALREYLGDADKTIVLEECDLDGEIRAYSAYRTVHILGGRYTFGDVLGCSVSDDYAVRRGDSVIDLSGETSSDTGSVAGRAVVGGLIAGPAGALLGGATASSSTDLSGTVRHGDDTLLHDYTVRVTVRDIARPTIGIHVGSDATKASEIAALFDVIIDNNRRG